ncbi:MAG: N-acetyltransferase [Flavobacteriales bacterium]|nr:MAG: N-acetyltransferase [Flavobacteriales bacterium]
MIHIRFANINDLPFIVKIYNQAIKSKKATADIHPFKLEQRIDWFNEFDKNNYPIYIAEFKNKVVGYATLSPYRTGRNALNKVAEISFYLDYNSLKQGIGSALVKHIVADCSRVNKETLLAILLNVNTPSIKLLKKFNFEEWGNLPLRSDFNGKRYNHLIYGLNLKDD